MVVVGYIGYIYQIQNKAMENIMPGRAGSSRGSAPSAPYLNEARPTTVPGRAFFIMKNAHAWQGIFQNIMPGRAGGSRGSAPSVPYLNEARPTTISSEALSGRRGAPTGAEVRGVALAIFLMFLTKIFQIFLSRHSC
jgi:hypothetical protein